MENIKKNKSKANSKVQTKKEQWKENSLHIIFLKLMDYHDKIYSFITDLD